VSPLLALVLLPVSPAFFLGVLVGKEPALAPLGLLVYYGLPSLLYALGRRAFRLGLFPPAPAAALALPYLPYFLLAGAARAPLGKVYKAFLAGPGVAVPLSVLLLWPLGAKVSPFLLGALTLGLAFLGERALRSMRAKEART